MPEDGQRTRTAWDRQAVADACATLGGLGRLGPAPGTLGTLAAWLVLAPAGILLGREVLWLLFVPVLLIGFWSIRVCLETDDRDPPEIVIDEVAGVWLALLLAPPGWLSYALAGVLFRLFDIRKPWIIGRIDRGLAGARGVMGDDLLAGVCAGVSARLLILLWSLVPPWPGG